ncbi:hypothetical protein ACQPXB_43300 [Amycolatopsis sp. CA-161197]|uniref:hypothetical protein n=1 Tax=Amycolatopsis sp. CA-161197 TaxID=3239922 RepID=UPI003D8A8382
MSVWGFCLRCFCFARLNCSCFCFAYFGSSSDFTFFSGFDAFARFGSALATLRFRPGVACHISSADHTRFGDFAHLGMCLTALRFRPGVACQVGFADHLGTTFADHTHFCNSARLRPSPTGLRLRPVSSRRDLGFASYFSGFDAFGDSARRSRSLATLRFGLNVRSHIVSAGHPGTSFADRTDFADFARFSLSLAAVCARLVVRCRGLSFAGYFGASVADLVRSGLDCSAVFFGFGDFALRMLSFARLSLGRVGFARFGARGSNLCGRG